jgi:CubicO group peptidase (beta-lactamase class C family)
MNIAKNFTVLFLMVAAVASLFANDCSAKMLPDAKRTKLCSEVNCEIPFVSSCSGRGIDDCAQIFKAEIRDGVIHGAAVIAGGLEGETVSGAWGWSDSAHKVPMTTRTVVDVASVTKAAAGVTAYLVAHAKGLIDFDTPFTNYLCSYTAPLSRNVTVRDLANHVSGFGEADGSPRVYLSKDAKKMICNILSMPPSEPMNDRVFYSCRNYVLLGQIFESVLKCDIAGFCRKGIFAPAGMVDTSIGTPLVHVEKERLAQTMGTKCPGVISDFVARPLWAEGIGTFNAGMFTSAEDMAKIGLLCLNKGRWGDRQIVSSPWIEKMTQPRTVEGPYFRGMDYGYLWWIIDREKHIYAAIGNSGNVIYVHPEKNLAIAVASYFKPTVFDRIDFIQEYIEPFVSGKP